jgi:hypothetical protein
MPEETDHPGPATSFEGWYVGQPGDKDKLVGPVRFSSTGIVTKSRWVAGGGGRGEQSPQQQRLTLRWGSHCL